MIMEHLGFTPRQIAVDIAMGQIYSAAVGERGAVCGFGMPEEKILAVRAELAKLHDELGLSAGLRAPSLAAELQRLSA